MSKLATLRGQLSALRRRRQMARWATAYSALVVTLVLVLAVIFLLDWRFEMTRPQRVVAMLAGLGVLVWAARRYTLPWLGHRETDVDMALLVERQQRIDSDLVAAIQFEEPEAARWGSTQLEGAVIDYVAEYGRGWDVLEGFDRQQVVRRLGALLAVVALVVIAAVLFPSYLATFANRLAMGSRHYPTNTSIDRVLVNGQEIDVYAGEEIVVRTAYGSPLAFSVQGSGELPAAGRAQLTTLASGVQRDLELTPAESTGETRDFEGKLPQLVDSVGFQVYLGDAYTDPARIEVIPLPVVEVKLTPHPPRYAQHAEKEAGAPVTSRQLSVIEGSRVELDVRSVNKPLERATIRIGDKDYQLVKKEAEGEASSEEAGRTWTLPVDGTPLASVTDQVSYSIQVTDADKLQLQQPIKGLIRLKADRKPIVTAGMETQHVLPSAKPQIDYRATDDYGVAQVLLHVEVLQQGLPGEPGASTAQKPVVIRQVETKDLAPSLDGSYTLDLSKLKLAKGDQVKVTVEAVDYRGGGLGQSEQSEPLTLNVTDLGGVYAAMHELEEKAYNQTGALIDRQTETGGSR